MPSSNALLRNHPLAASVLLAATVAAGAVYLSTRQLPAQAIVQSYEKIRGNMITAFLSSGSLLFSLNSFVLVNLKKDIFESAQYLQAMESRNISRSAIYQPLIDLNALIGLVIFMSLSTVMLNLLLGVFQSLTVILFCVFISCFTLTLLMICLFNIWKNINFWLRKSSEKI